MPWNSEWVNASKDGLAANKVSHRCCNVKWHDELSVGTKGFVNLEALPGDSACALLVFWCLRDSWERGVEEWQSLASVVSHEDAGDRHDGHESVQGVVAEAAERILNTVGARDLFHVVRLAIQQAVSQTRSHQHAGQQSQRLVQVHQSTLVFLRCRLSLEHTADASHHGKRNRPVEVGCDDSVCCLCAHLCCLIVVLSCFILVFVRLL
mmetsp:Transcript_623/g.1760  ORF Transcript_623/g.1760 Transcript_623/m.1760 type:complete len:208 (+) Transcript_623:312-935(+)